MNVQDGHTYLEHCVIIKRIILDDRGCLFYLFEAMKQYQVVWETKEKVFTKEISQKTFKII